MLITAVSRLVNVHSGSYTCMAAGSVKIGKDCLIAAHTGIVANNHNFADPAQKIRDQGYPKREF